MENEKFLLTLCENIRILRQRKGLSLEEMADQLGIGIDMLLLLESGILPEELEVDTLVRASRVFGIAINELFFPCS
ncbi:MAG: helix-turn-helix transcriptional regulator [Eubacteriales bacterium]|nr:helix-turn-helix transcriptional regulator [Eubacteriales bacterium]